MNEPQGPDNGLYPVPTKPASKAPQVTPEDQKFNSTKPAEIVKEKEETQVEEKTPKPAAAVPENDDETVVEKRGKGKRGKDRAPRRKRVMTEKMLDNLKKAREVARQKRLAKKKENAQVEVPKPIEAKAKVEDVKVAVKEVLPKPPQLVRQHAIQIEEEEQDPDFADFMAFKTFKANKKRHRQRPRAKRETPQQSHRYETKQATMSAPARRAPPVQTKRQTRVAKPVQPRKKPNNWHSMLQSSGLF